MFRTPRYPRSRYQWDGLTRWERAMQIDPTSVTREEDGVWTVEASSGYDSYYVRRQVYHCDYQVGVLSIRS